MGNKKKVIALASFVGGVNVLFSSNYIISLIIVSLELIVLIYHFVNKNIIKYLGNYLIFLCLSFEFSTLVGDNKFYGFKNFRILGINLGIISLFPILLLLIFRKNISIKKIKKKSIHLYYFIKLVLFMNITGVFIGLTQIIINDNNIQMMDNVSLNFIGEIYKKIAIPLLILISIIYIINYEYEKIEYIEDYLIAILIGLVISMIVSLLTNNYGYYGGVDTLLVPNIIQFVPFMLLFPFYKRTKPYKTTFGFGIIGMILTLLYNAKGKIILLYFLIPLGIIIILLAKRKWIYLTIMMLVLSIFVLTGNKYISFLIENSNMFRSKINQVISLLQFWDSNWLISMPSSPRIRIVEFINIVYEYIEKPWYFLFGKGYMGTIKDHIGFLDEYLVGSYPIQQWKNNAFYGVHETLNSIFLNHGMSGMIIYFYYIKIVFSNFHLNPWILIGGYWFLMFYGFSVTLSAFGITSLILGFIKIDSKINYLR